MTAGSVRRALAGAVLVVATACAARPAPPAVTAPRYPDYPALDVPVSLGAPRRAIESHDLAWRRLQAGDLGGASRDFQNALKQAPDFYPAEAGLGFVHLAGRQYRQAETRFEAVLASDSAYLPAWIGQAEALLGLGNDEGAIAAMERILSLDPDRENVRSRLELVRFRQLQVLIEDGRRARADGRLDDARDRLQRALALSPSSTLILHELAAAETAAGALTEAEAHARRAIELDPSDPAGHARLGEVLEAAGRYRDAAAAFTRAAALDARPEWRVRAAELLEKAELAALPPEFGSLERATTITRAHVAAYVAIRLASLVERAPRRARVGATDGRNHWAAPWILPMTQRGLMDVLPNHTFQPEAVVRRNDLAQLVSRLVPIAAADRPGDLAAWDAERPRFSDLSATHVFYRAAALAVASGVMRPGADDRFEPTRAAAGAELTAAVDRLRQLAGR